MKSSLLTTLRTLRILTCVSFLFAAELRADPEMTLPNPGALPRSDPAVDGVLNAFKRRPVVLLGDVHGVAQQGEFYNRLVSDSRFPDVVQNIVTEVGAGQHQSTIDAYVQGRDVAYSELRRVWADSVSWQVGYTSTLYPSFFAAVRAANLSLPEEKRIRVWLADPPVNWSEINNITQLIPLFEKRNVHAAKLIREQILNRQQKALVIFGGTHLYPRLPHPMFPDGSVVSNLEQTHPGSTFTIMTHVGSFTPQATQRIERLFRAAKLKPGTLLQPVRGTWLQQILSNPRYQFVPPSPTGDLAPPEVNRVFSGEWADAYLYLGDRADLIEAPIEVSGFMDTTFLKELDRRHQIRDGGPIRLPDLLDATVARTLFSE